jgi:nicotinamidase/pyrazinamidase
MQHMKKIFVDVDVQRDFCDPDGALYVRGSPNKVFRDIVAHAMKQGIPILGSVDSHAWDAWEFASSGLAGPEGETPNFPNHCVKGTPGWLKVAGTLPNRFRFLPNVADMRFDSIVREVLYGQTQGVYFEKEVYSLFANPLAERFVQTLADLAGEPLEFYVFGVATDYCVRAAALGLAERGYRTTLLTDAVAGITEEGVQKAIAEMRAAGVKLATTAELWS